MKNNTNITDSLTQLDELCSSGYAIALHISFTTPRFLFQSYSKDWMEVYSQEGLVLKDPTVLWGFSNTGFANWSDLKDIDDSGILPMAAKFGLKYGFTYSTDQNSSKTIASFARSDREFSDSEVAEISEISLNLHIHTANIEEFSAAEMGQLKAMSVQFTRG